MRRDESKRYARLLTLPLILLMTVLLMVMVGGCGGDGSAATTAAAPSTETTAVTVSPTTSESPATTASTVAAAEPTGQIGGTVTASSTNGGYPTDNIPDWSQIKSVEAYRSASMGGSSIYMSLATYGVTANSVSEYSSLPSPEAGQGRIELLLTRTVAGVNEPPLVTGTYDFSVPQGQVELTGAAAIVLPNGTAVTFVTAGLESDVQVTAVSDTEISGTFHVKDKWSEISGTFTAPVK